MKENSIVPDEKPSTTLPGIVEKVIKPRDPRDPEKAQIAVEGADHLYREIRIDNTLNDANGQEVALPPGAPVEVTVAVDPDCQEVKTAQGTPVVRAGFRSGSPVREAQLACQPGERPTPRPLGSL